MNILITGSSQGIGYELAKEFSKKERISLLLISRSKEKLENLAKECTQLNKNVSIEIIPFDLSQLALGESLPLVHKTHIDILINNAGILVKEELRKLTLNEISQMIEVNFQAPLLLVKTLLPYLGGNKPSHVVNIGSMGGFQGSEKFPGLSVYSATKAALSCLSECLAAELFEDKIKMNCLALGAAQTEMLEAAFPGYQAPVSAAEMAKYIADFAINGHKYHNGKVIPVSVSTP